MKGTSDFEDEAEDESWEEVNEEAILTQATVTRMREVKVK